MVWIMQPMEFLVVSIPSISLKFLLFSVAFIFKNSHRFFFGHYVVDDIWVTSFHSLFDFIRFFRRVINDVFILRSFTLILRYMLTFFVKNYRTLATYLLEFKS